MVAPGPAFAERFSVWGVDLDPGKGSEQSGYRPVLVVSPNEMNSNLRTVIVAPMTTRLRQWPTRVKIRHASKTGDVALDQLRTLDQARLLRPMGRLNARYQAQVLAVLAEMFAY
jgi:mRNA interferase MazF